MGTKSDDKLDKMVAITTAIISVLLAIASILGNNPAATPLYLIKSTDQWSYYQSKSIKLNLYESNREKQDIQAEAEKFQAHSEHDNDKSDNYNYAFGFY